MMRNLKQHISFLFLCVFFTKMAICLATLKFSDCDQQRIYSVIMQLEIENEQHPNEDAKEIFAKEKKFVKFEWTSTKKDILNAADNISQNVLNFYPINKDYTEIVTPPPEFIIS